MWNTLLFVAAVLLAAVTTPSAGTPTYQETGDCEVNSMTITTLLLSSFFCEWQATHEHLYKYSSKEEYFGKEYSETFEMAINFKVFCISGKKSYTLTCL